ncbi:hypothetical protein [Hydrogenophaga sp.]|uniref:hypothetical protein n=1 Tax=Hydrogenophaga sp. TaxID=1904254 RepID=UPI0025BD8B8A|nr:hypothetical protein [Hydrogenophaga sp.]
MKRFLSMPLMASSLPALAHEGHGLFGSHWHATDALGFLVVGVLITLAIWFSSK